MMNSIERAPREQGPIQRALFFSSVFLIWNIFIYTPIILHRGNITEFDVNLLAILKYLSLPGAILFLLFLGFGRVLPKKHVPFYVTLIFSLGILFWLQGHLLVWKYGLLDGREIDWTKQAWQGWLDGTLWMAVLTLSCVFYKKIYKLATSTVIILLVLQAVYLIFLSLDNPGKQEARRAFSPSLAPPDEIHHFSANSNVIHIILDAFQSDLFQDIIAENPNYYQTTLEGFTVFNEAIGAYATTYMSIPAIFSGNYYTNEMPMREYVKKTLTGKTIPNVLFDNEYEVDFVHSVHLYAHGKFSNIYVIPHPYGTTQKQHEQTNAAFMMDLVLFRIAPHFLKHRVYNNQSWLIQNIFNKGDTYLQISQKSFFDDFIEKMSIRRNKPVYKYLHLVITHPPTVVNENCEFAGKVLPYTRENLLIQNRCALQQFIKFLDHLKSLGIYDTSFIILQADHGVRMPVNTTHKEGYWRYFANEQNFSEIVGSALPLLAMKPPFSKGLLKNSSAQVTITDIPATMASVLKLPAEFPGRSVFDVEPSEVRTRRFFHYLFQHKHWESDYLDRLDEYQIEGSVFDRDAWRLKQIHIAPGRHISHEEGALIRFGKAGNAQSYQREGWSEPEEGFTWTNGRISSLVIPIIPPTLPSATMKASLSAFIVPGKIERQVVHILINGRKAGEWIITNEGLQEQILEIPKHFFDDPSQIIITFELPDAVSPLQIKSSGDKRILGIAFRTITIHP